MALSGKVFAERKPIKGSEGSRLAKQEDTLAVAAGDFTEFGTLPRKTIIRLGLRHVSTMPVVLLNGSKVQVPVYQAEVLDRKQWRTVYVCEDNAGSAR